MVFIVFEGGEGSGKSTQLMTLADALRGQGCDVVTTREPGGSPRAEQIREIILGPESHDLDPRCEALLFAAARADHTTTVIRPALQRGAVVLCDRYWDSSVAYQGQARGLGQEYITDLSSWATRDLVPDLTIVLDIDPRVGLTRAEDHNRLEAEELSFHTEVRRTFRMLAERAPHRYAVIDAGASPGDVAAAVWGAVRPAVEAL